MLDIGKLADFFAGEPEPPYSPSIRGIAESDSEDGEVEVYLGEMEQVYQTSVQPLYETDEDGELVYDDEGEKVQMTDENGDPMTAEQVVYDADGNPVPVLDSDGNPVFSKVQLVDADGDPILEYDADGNPIAQTDAQGNPIYAEDEDGNRIPVLDDAGEQVYTYEDDGTAVPLYEVVPVEESQVAVIETIGTVRAGESPVISMGGAASTAIAAGGWGDSLELTFTQLGDSVTVAQTIADEANAVATATNQHFWTDTAGIHVTEATQESWGQTHTGHNILINSLGLLLRNALDNLVSITRSAIAFFDGLGNDPENITASFGADGAIVGSTSTSRVAIDGSGMSIVDSDGLLISEIGLSGQDSPGRVSMRVRIDYDGFEQGYDQYSGRSKRLPDAVSGSGIVVFIWSELNGALGSDAINFISGTSDTVTRPVSTAIRRYGYNVEYDADSGIITIETATDPSWGYSHFYGTVEFQSAARPAPAFTFGTRTSRNTKGPYSVAAGQGLIAASGTQTVLGKYNVADSSGDYAVIVGNGTSEDARSNAFTVDWDGNVKTSGSLMSILSYGHSTWADFLAAYNTNSVVYCRASSNSNPATGSQTRLAFMAYVNNETAPTNVEFQYYRSVSSHTASQQGDQVYVYKLTNTGAWSVTVREASVKVAAGTGLTMAYSGGTATFAAKMLTGSVQVTVVANGETPEADRAQVTFPSAITGSSPSVFFTIGSSPSTWHMRDLHFGYNLIGDSTNGYTGFYVRCYNAGSNTGTPWVRWLAVWS